MIDTILSELLHFLHYLIDCISAENRYGFAHSIIHKNILMIIYNIYWLISSDQ
jgi:hypothetical protein